jgi:CMP-2-keto-3-deoxyoctulosonic acid synthetase
MNIAVIISTCYESSGLQAKQLQDICRNLMIGRVYLQARQVAGFNAVYAVIDADRTYRACGERGVPCIMTSVKYKTGTDRVGEAAEKIPAGPVREYPGGGGGR